MTTIYSRWADVPDHLKTRKMLSDAGLKPAPDQKPVATKYSAGVRYSLFDINQAVPKRQMSDAQRTALAAARSKAQENATCKRCGFSGNEVRESGERLCEDCQFARKLVRHHNKAIRWARSALDTPGVVILDTETTGLYDEAQVIQLAILSITGQALFDSYLRPSVSIEPGAAAVHGLTIEMLANAPTIVDVWPVVSVILDSATSIVVYNAEFDHGRLCETLRAWGLDEMPYDKFSCAMHAYSEYVNQWSNYHRSFRWQKLPAGDHTALGDCRATLEVLRTMAESQLREE